MTLQTEVTALRQEVSGLRDQLEITKTVAARHEEQISGQPGGILAAIRGLVDEWTGMKRALYTASVSVVVSMLGFAFAISRIIG